MQTEEKYVWVCLFTCVAVMANHLQIVADLSAEEFLLVLHRFIARQGSYTKLLWTVHLNLN